MTSSKRASPPRRMNTQPRLSRTTRRAPQGQSADVARITAKAFGDGLQIRTGMAPTGVAVGPERVPVVNEVANGADSGGVGHRCLS